MSRHCLSLMDLMNSAIRKEKLIGNLLIAKVISGDTLFHTSIINFISICFKIAQRLSASESSC